MKLFGQTLRRRGSLQLSINAIVILVMAMVVLGLGLTFIRNLFGGAQENFGRIIDNTQLENPASPDNPITIELYQRGADRIFTKTINVKGNDMLSRGVILRLKDIGRVRARKLFNFVQL